MNFTTQIQIPKNPQPITYQSCVMSWGSCFAENMGAKFEYYKFKTSTNPFGIVFNPVSIEKLLNRVVHKIEFTEKDIFFYNEQWHCYEVHSLLSNSNKQAFLDDLNKLILQTFDYLLETSHLIITYGTSWVYRNAESNQVVANCHKVPQKHFLKELLSVETIQKSIENTVKLIELINPTCNFIFTISPVRHLKDGFVENQRSKAHLITALHESVQHINTINGKQLTVNYFPSYEIVLDELRDYRFYGLDMLHPSTIAIDYIWDKFKTSTISDDNFSIMEEVERIQKMMAHKPFDTTSDSYKKMLKTIEFKKERLLIKNSSIRF